MSLTKYQSKRTFSKTPEPTGQTKRGSKRDKKLHFLHFVVQKHAASHLHYDFRLELNGVLMSWAIPKGPSLDPAHKRLAMKVEDHPLDYRLFEGVIPEGNYGAGTVMVWDEGLYCVNPQFSFQENEQAIRRGLQQGELKFKLEGQKLKGNFVLVAIKSRDKRRENSWLLMKEPDEFATHDEILLQDRSVLTKKRLDEIEHSTKPTNHSKKTTPKHESTQAIKIPPEAKKSRMPHDIQPMLSTLIDKPFDREGWFFELKLDGFRAIAEIQNKKIQFYSRNLISFEERFRSIFEALQRLTTPMVLDGEVVALDDDGKPDFQLLQDAENHQERLVYYVFDLLFYNGYDLRHVPLAQRKELLSQLLPQNEGTIRYCAHIETHGTDFFSVVRAQGIEGILAKDASSPYISGKRTSKWLKIKTQKQQEAIICGFTEPRGTRKHFGALILGVYENKEIQYIGHTGTGMTDNLLTELHKMLQPLITPNCPFKKKPKTNEKATWVKPQIVCEIHFTEWTHDGYARHPVFMGLRPDKSASEVIREIEKSTDVQLSTSSPSTKKFGPPKFGREAPQKQPKSKTLEPEAPRKKFGATPPGSEDLVLNVSGHRVHVTHPDKLFWPALNYRKKELVSYYEKMAETILPYLKDRPFVLHRYPDGIEGDDFYQKDMAQQDLPHWVETLEIYSESNEETIHYILCQNTETLLYLANFGCIEMNPWNSRKQNLENPDWMVIDLDPSAKNTFEQVIESAQVVHAILENFKVPHYCKTSGATGLHIYVPTGAQYRYEVVRSFGEIIATLTTQELPKITSLERALSKRSQKQIYVDYLQNRYGQTLVAPYSLKPTPEATVSTPLHWEEVKKGLKPQQFTMDNILSRVAQEGDLWKPVLGPGIDFNKLINSIK